MFGIIKVSKNHKSMSPLCYFQHEEAAVKVFKSLIEKSDVRLLLVTNFDPHETDYTKFPIIEDYRPKAPRPKRVYNYHYMSRKEIREENERQKQKEKEEYANKKISLNNQDKIISAEKQKKKPKIFRFQFKLLDLKSNLIFISKLLWPLEYDLNYFKMISESELDKNQHLIISCFAKTQIEAEKFIKQKIKEMTKQNKQEKK